MYEIAFRIEFGLYEYLVMSLGLTNAPTTFHTVMDRIFRKYRSFMRVFDDIIVYSKTLEEPKKHLEKVYGELKSHKLYVNSKKGELFINEI